MKALIARLLVGTMCSMLFIPALRAEEAAPATPAAEKAAAPAVTAPAATSPEQELLNRMIREGEIRRQANEQIARQYLASGNKRFEERLYEQAAAAYEQALAANPNLAEAKEKLAVTRRLLGKTESGEPDSTSAIRDTIDVRTNYQHATLMQQIADSRDLIARKNYSDALAKLTEAKNLAKALAIRYDVRQQMMDIDAMMKQADSAQMKALTAEEQQKREAAVKLAQEENQRLENLQQQRVQRMLADGKKLSSDGRYALAAKKYEEVLKIEPKNQEAAMARDDAYARVNEENHIVFTKEKEIQTQRNWDNLLEQRVPWPDAEPIYPADWEEQKAKAAARAAIEVEEDAPWLKELKSRLEEKTRFDFVATSLEDVIAYLHQQHAGVNFVLDRAAIKAKAAEGQDMEVTLKMDGVKLKTGLDQILKMLGLAYTLENEAVFISTKENIANSRQTVTRFYDVNDLTLEIRNFASDTRAIAQSSDYSTSTSTDIFAPGGGDTGPAKPETFTGDTLKEFIMTVIAPGTWTDLEQAGGTPP